MPPFHQFLLDTIGHLCFAFTHCPTATANLPILSTICMRFHLIVRSAGTSLLFGMHVRLIEFHVNVTSDLSCPSYAIVRPRAGECEYATMGQGR